ncbi:Hypothetical protein R9X50_00002400 [Acrodontium crateriforme]|uniref:Uncharacterized protein n=1 Tax=Acrodontium crateriforme TaxID=150365 RepID=A0AAQ3R8W3_9PEZI|nr:Hypothetical protein R9X50_00002400 [Acrodontium crateriforme]
MPPSRDSFQSNPNHHHPLSSPQSDVPETTENTKSTSTPWSALFFFTSGPSVPMLVFGILFSILAGAISPINAFFSGQVFNGFSLYAGGHWDKDKLLKEERICVIYLVGLAGGSWLLHSLQLMSWLTFGELQAKHARDRMFHSLLDKDVEWFEMRKNGIGALLPRLQTHIHDLQLATSQPLGVLFALASTAILSLAQAFYRSWDLTLVILSTSPLIIITMTWLGNRTQNLLSKQKIPLNEAQKVSTNMISNIDTVKCFNGQYFEAKKYVQKTTMGARIYYSVVNAAAMQMAFLVLLSVSMFVQGFYYGGVLIDRGKKDSSDVVTTFLSTMGAFQAIQAFLPQMIVLEKGRAGGATLRAMMAEVKDDKSHEQGCGSIRPPHCYGEIRVKNLSFAYPLQPSRLTLNNVSMHIPGGEVTFLIGQSGSGKSTLGQLLMRFYTSFSGSLTIDGQAIETLDVNWLRSNITLVEQQSLLFNDTIFRNIAFGKKNYKSATMEGVKAASEFALLQMMISDMSEGYDTLVGAKGGTLSGGQRQRMALARARIRDTPIVILDESTSALDQISRALMMEAIRQWRRGKTTIIITHDISQILPEDFVHVLENGRLVQEGYRQNLEKIKGTPFQTFLPEEQRAKASPFDARKRSTFDPFEPNRRSRGNFPPPWDSHSRRLNPLEAQLNAFENNISSFVKTLPRDRTSFGFGRPGFKVSPWLRMALPAPLRSYANERPDSIHGWEKSPHPLTALASRGTAIQEDDNKRSSQMLFNLVNLTGQHAADTRLSTARVGRRQINTMNQKPGLRNSAGSENLSVKGGSDSAGPVTSDIKRSLTQIMATIWPNIDWSARILLVMGFWGATVHGVGTPVFAFILSKLLQTYAVPGVDKHEALIYSLCILAVAITDAAHTYIFRFFLECVAQSWVDNIRAEGVRRILAQPKAFFDEEENSVSRLTDCLDRNAEEMRNLLGRFAPLAYVAALITFVSVAWALSSNWKMTIIAIAMAPYIFLVTKAFFAVSARWETLSNDVSEEVSAIFTETFTNIKTVRGLTLEAHFSEKYVAATNNALIVGFKRSIYVGFFYGVSDSAGAFALALVFYIGAWLVSIQGADVTGVIQVFVMLMFAIQQVSEILDYIPQMGMAQDTGSRLLRLSRLPILSHESLGDICLTSVGDIIFNRLTFAYPSRPKQTILKDVSLRIRPGTSTAIVGGSGSGKSTIANLLLGIYSASPSTSPEPSNAKSKSALKISSHQIEDISTHSLRTLIVPVQQTPTLFAASIAENISYGLCTTSPFYNAASIRAASEMVGIHTFITSLPQGYETLVGDGGTGLSGGQAQRIALARALVRNPDVLILDEATSALDVEAAAMIRDTLKKLVNGRSQEQPLAARGSRDSRGKSPKRKMTLIVITHAKEMMELAEQVVVLADGRVVESGGFEQLMAAKGPLVNLLNGGLWDEESEMHPRGRDEMDEIAMSPYYS